ncbi:hypothetical protein PHMEG_00016399 [Phytophthora megakarya]|uniref:Uncharacterized protein n=1 Tax=Phytophthora megakarya TaxID=4795 RepID=A0A225VZE4_9STRA|nr:hypothetical protein PHMEG_00016399 [Phytophthora megakarya]
MGLPTSKNLKSILTLMVREKDEFSFDRYCKPAETLCKKKKEFWTRCDAPIYVARFRISTTTRIIALKPVGELPKEFSTDTWDECVDHLLFSSK